MENEGEHSICHMRMMDGNIKFMKSENSEIPEGALQLLLFFY